MFQEGKQQVKQGVLTQFNPGKVWPDNNGIHINAHGGGILFYDGSYYWFGEHKIEGEAGNVAHVGVHVYSSTDLYNWTDEGIALQVSNDTQSDIADGCVIERPKVVYNETTRQFVMWFHLELIGQEYNCALSGVAVSDNASGPYTYVRSFHPNAGHWPHNVTPEMKDPESIQRTKDEQNDFSCGPSAKHATFNILGAHVDGGQHARDMTLFVDDDGKAYHLYSSEFNSTLHISLLTDDYLDEAGTYVRAFPYRWMEAPAMCKHNGKYYLIASDCTGWAPNAARSAVANSILGPWQELGNLCVGINPKNGLGPDNSFGGQSTFILPVQGKEDAFIAMFDIWRPKDAIDGRHIWLPIQFSDSGFKIEWMDQWDLSFFEFGLKHFGEQSPGGDIL